MHIKRKSDFFPKNYFNIIPVSETVSPSCYFSLIKFQDENCDFRLFPSIWDLKIIILGYCDINTSRKHRNYRCELFFLVTTLPVNRVLWFCLLIQYLYGEVDWRHWWSQMLILGSGLWSYFNCSVKSLRCLSRGNLLFMVSLTFLGNEIYFQINTQI